MNNWPPRQREVRILFFGTPAFAAPVLHCLIDGAPRGWEVVGVVTQPDRPAGRSHVLKPPPIKEIALAAGVPVLQPERLRDDAAIGAIAALRPTVGLLFSYAQLLPRALLRLPPAGILNVHPSLLPRYRGPSPIQSALLQGDAETGVSLIKLVARMDAGPIVAQERLAVPERATAPELTETLAAIGAELVARYLDPWVAGALLPQPQSEAEATYCPLLTRESGRIDWTRSAVALDRQVRALLPWPAAFTTWRGRQLNVLQAHAIAWPASAPPGVVLRPTFVSEAEPRADAIPLAVATGAGALCLDVVQLEGGRPMDAASFSRGQPALPGSRLGA